jgi:hypothetical protein
MVFPFIMLVSRKGLFAARSASWRFCRADFLIPRQSIPWPLSHAPKPSYILVGVQTLET